MSNTVITNYTDLNGPSTKADSSVVVIVNKDGSLSVDENLLGTLMGTDGSQAAGISVVRVGHEGRPDDATDSESDDDKVAHVTLSVDSYYDEPNSIIKYDSGAEMLQSFRTETRENSLLGFQNDHCYTPLTSPISSEHRSDSYAGYDDQPIIEIKQQPPPKPLPSSKKITILEQKIIPKGRKIPVTAEPAFILKGNDILNKPLPVNKAKTASNKALIEQKSEESTEESSSASSSGDSIADRDSDSDYKEARDKSGSIKKSKVKARILKNPSAKGGKLDSKAVSRLKSSRKSLKKDIKEKLLNKSGNVEKRSEKVTPASPTVEQKKENPKQTPKPSKKDKKTPAHLSAALLSDMTSLFSTPDVIRRISTDNKTPSNKDSTPGNSKDDTNKTIDHKQKVSQRIKQRNIPGSKGFDPMHMPQIDDASLAQILQDTNPVKSQVTSAVAMNSPSLAGPLSPTLDLLAGLQPEEEGLTEDLLMHVAQLVESSENLQEVIDKQVLGKVDVSSKSAESSALAPGDNLYTPSKSAKTLGPRKDPIEIVRRDGRVITLPPIEAPATRSSKRKSQVEPASSTDASPTAPPVAAASPAMPAEAPPAPAAGPPDTSPQLSSVSKHYINKKLFAKKTEDPEIDPVVVDKVSAESQESWNSEDDPNRLWCICRQPHNNRFMICCDGCEDWFHGKCVNITKAMGQQMEEQGIEWRCPNCVKKVKTPKTVQSKLPLVPKRRLGEEGPGTGGGAGRSTCIVCARAARPSSIYCSDACILKHAQDSLGAHASPIKMNEAGKPQDKSKADSRVIVFERRTGRCLAGPSAPTAENLRAWLQKNPTFEVVRPGTLSSIKPHIKKPVPEGNKIQTTLNFARIQKRNPNQSVLKPQPDIKESTPKVATPVSKVATPISKVATPVSKSGTPVSKVTASVSKVTTPVSKAPTPVSKAPTPVSKAATPVSKAATPVAKVVTPVTKVVTPIREENKTVPQPKTPTTPRFLHMINPRESPKPSTSTARPAPVEVKKPARTLNRSQSNAAKASVSPATSRRKEAPDAKNRMGSEEPIRENVRKALLEHMTIRMGETKGAKLTNKEIKEFAAETESELHDLFRDVGMKYKAKYRSLMFNIKDRKNLTLWEKICEKELTPKQLVRLSPEELASQELAQWRDKEAKHQLELIKKNEIDLLAASKTYVLKTHKGEEVMENKEGISTELDPNVPVEDLVSALNDSTAGEQPPPEESPTEKGTSIRKLSQDSDKADIYSSSKKKSKDDEKASRRSTRESKRESERKSSRSSKNKSESKPKEERSSRRSDKKSSKARSSSKERKQESSKEKASSTEVERRTSSRAKTRSSKSHSRSQERERSRSREREPRETRKRHRSRSKHRTSTDEKKLRSRSQETTKSKHDSTDSDTVERPKSALMKEVHPEYDPHEPMITSAFSEEDLRKSREDIYADSLNAAEIGDYDNAVYDPVKFSIGSKVPPRKSTRRREKMSEAESDQEPSSTVENTGVVVWNGCINMVDVARFYVAAHEVSGQGTDLEEDLSTELDIVGRINPETVWDYITKMKRAGNKDIVVLRLQAANDEEKMQYIALFSYLSTRNRLGVVKVSNTTTVKDFYIVPLPANTELPAVLLPLDGPGLETVKNHLLIGIVVRQRKKRPAPAHIPKDVVPSKVSRTSRKRSYTPPPLAAAAATAASQYSSPALSTSVKDKIAASLASANDDDEAYSPGSSSTESGGGVTTRAAAAGASTSTLRSKVYELNRQIEEQKQQILKMVQKPTTSNEDENEAYSPSRPMTPPDEAPAAVNPLADIALPSNLHEILATIKQRSGDVDMRSQPSV